jgi:hypothetical protein
MSSLWDDGLLVDETPYDVFIKKGEFVDKDRSNRVVPYKLYYPEINNIEEKLPLVIWSHGLGGGRDGAAFLSRFIAGHGYYVLNIQHQGTDTSIWEGKDGHPWDVIRATHISRRTTLQRFKDIPFVINELEMLSKDFSLMSKTADLDKIGMSGHSFGAITTQIMAGQKLGKNNRFYSLKDNRIKAGIAYSMSPTYNHDQPHEIIYGGISIPMFYMTGTEDNSPISNKSYHYRLPIFEHAQTPDQHLVVLDKGDHMVFAGSRGKLGSNPNRKEHEKIIKILSLAFWEAYLKNNQKAKAWLSGSAIAKWLGDNANYKYRG